jgi:diguanylate cyclase (GGDEF)-like protein
LQLHNLEESLTREIARAQRHHHSIGIIMLDIDHFKRFNDTFGHDAGDYVLKAVGNLLKASVRSSDIACRYGGEELTLILPELSLSETATKADLIREAIAQLQLSRNGQILGTLTASLGVATFPEHGVTGDVVVQSADAALYRAKAAGRNQVMVAP